MYLQAEARLSLTALAKRERMNASTVWRWAQKGVRGVRLETYVLGGRRYTTDDAYLRFIQATTEAACCQAPLLPNAHRTTAIEQAEAELDAAGVR